MYLKLKLLGYHKFYNLKSHICDTKGEDKIISFQHLIRDKQELFDKVG